MGLFRADPNQTVDQKRQASTYFGLTGAVMLFGSVYLAYLGSWGWLLVGVPGGIIALRHAWRREAEANQLEED